ncbi:MAG: hypothetical protein H7Y11_00690 [Armatimonadetes bacterium]|nr:hypothetical protein [Anaerolineae bacterium]
MTDNFLTRFFQVAQQVTRAERGFALDTGFEVVATYNLDDSTLTERVFNDFAYTWLRRAMEDNKPIITNNIITDSRKAPDTNTGFSNLRVVVCIPLYGHGGFYLDQHIRNGIIPRNIIDRLGDAFYTLQKNQQADATVEDILAVFNRMR